MLSELSPGKVFHGRYEVIRVIKAGGMGAVYEVVHLETRRHRALKVMLPSIVRDETMRTRFRMEAQITADVESDHIVETFDAGVDPETGVPFLVMELLRGEDLAHHVRARGPIPASQVVGLLQQLARALEQTHASGIVHRDLKPENLFLAARGDDPPRLKVLDFGIAKIVAHSSGDAGTTSLGTPLYMATEQFQGAEVSPRTDLFAFGHIAYTLLVGHHYWADEAARFGILPLIERLAHGSDEAASIRAARHGVMLSPAFDTWFRRATARVAQDRFERARDQVNELALALDVSPSQATVPTPNVSWPARYGAASEAETALAPPSPGSVPSGRSPMSESAALSTTGVNAESAAAPAMTVVSAPDPPAAGGGEPAGAVQTHISSVRSIAESAPRSGRMRLYAVAAALALVVAAAAAGLLRSAQPTAAPGVQPTQSAAPVVTPPSESAPTPAVTMAETPKPPSPPVTVSPAPPETPPSVTMAETARPPTPPVTATPKPPVKPPPAVTTAPRAPSKPKDPSRVFD